MVDRYTKIVLTVIAAALCAIAVQNGVGSAEAVGDGCGGDSWNACHVTGHVQVSGSVHTY